MLHVHIWGLQIAQSLLQGCGEAAGVFSLEASVGLLVSGNGLPVPSPSLL